MNKIRCYMWWISLIALLIAGITAYCLCNEALSTRPAKMLSWSAGKLALPILSGMPWFVYGILLIIAVYIFIRHKLMMGLFIGALIGAIMALIGCTPY
jgi:hypothetical protein